MWHFWGGYSEADGTGMKARLTWDSTLTPSLCVFYKHECLVNVSYAYSAPSIVLRLYVLGLSFILRSHPPQPPPLKQCWDLQMSPGGSEMLGDLLKDTQEITESGFELHSFDSTALVFSILPLFQVLERFSLLGCWGWFVVEINLRSCKQKTPRSKLTRRLA